MTSMRSRRAEGIVSSTLAVVMKNTRDKIERHVEIVIAERAVLFGIEDLQQRRGRIAAEIGAQLVDFIEHEDRIARSRAADVLDDLARKRADVGSPMAADLRLVAHAAQRNADELPPHGVGDRSAERRLADARRTDKAKDGRLARRSQFENREVLEDAFLDLFQIVVIPIQNLLGAHECRSFPSSAHSTASVTSQSR